MNASRRRSTTAITHLIAAAMVVVAGACAPGAIEPLPTPPSVPETTTTVAIDFTAIGLPGVPGRTTTTLAMQPGEATISGSVVGPQGPVGGATVRAERIVGESTGSIDVVSDAEGKFAFTTMVGGRYRVRAWKAAPDNLALIDPEVFFLEGKESKVLALPIRPYQGLSVSSDTAPDPPVITEATNLVVQVVERSVDPQGVVRGLPVVGARIELFGAGDWRLRSANPSTSDGAGRASFTLECQRAGAQPLSVVIGETASFPLDIPPCSVPAVVSDDSSSSTTASPSGPTSSGVANTTTTTRTAPATTTSTTARQTTTTSRPATTTTTR